MADRKTKIIAVLPAYNAEKTLEKTLADIPRADIDEILLVDDASTDNTSGVAGYRVLRDGALVRRDYTVKPWQTWAPPEPAATETSSPGEVPGAHPAGVDF
jgi:hypothetical protein